MADPAGTDPAVAAMARSLRARAARHAFMMTLLLAIVAGAAIWLLVFDMWLGQVERQYLWENARHQLNMGPAVSLKGMMDAGRSAGAQAATGWSAMVVGAIAIAGRIGYRAGLASGSAAGATWTR